MRGFGGIGKDAVSGLVFVAIAIVGLVAAWDYPTGTALRMGTGYMPKLLCWLLLALGAFTTLKGLMRPAEPKEAEPFRLTPVILIPLALIVFAILLEQWGLLIAGGLLILIGGLAQNRPRVAEVCVAALVLVAVNWAIFVWALGLSVSALPGG